MIRSMNWFLNCNPAAMMSGCKKPDPAGHIDHRDDTRDLIWGVLSWDQERNGKSNFIKYACGRLLV